MLVAAPRFRSSETWLRYQSGKGTSKRPGEFVFRVHNRHFSLKRANPRNPLTPKSSQSHFLEPQRDSFTRLEELGFIETIQGKGSFVAGGNVELLREERLRHIEELLEQALAEAREAGLALEDVQSMLAIIYESDTQ